MTQPSYTPPGSSTAINAVTAYAYDGNGNLISETDPEDNTTTYGYNALGDKTSETDPQITGQSAPGQWAWTYDAAGEPLSSDRPHRRRDAEHLGTISASRRPRRRMSAAARQPSGTTTYGYDYQGDLTSAETPDGDHHHQHLRRHRRARLLPPTPTATPPRYTYNQLGEVAAVTNPDQHLRRLRLRPGQEHHQHHRLRHHRHQAGRAGRRLRRRRRPGLVDRRQPRHHDLRLRRGRADDQRGCSRSARPAAITTKFGYDAGGQPDCPTPTGNGNTTWTTYNSWNLPESQIEPPTTNLTRHAAERHLHHRLQRRRRAGHASPSPAVSQVTRHLQPVWAT